jgi:hypothetical protein
LFEPRRVSTEVRAATDQTIEAGYVLDVGCDVLVGFSHPSRIQP